MATTTTLQSASNVSELKMNAKDNAPNGNDAPNGNVNNTDNLDYPIPAPSMEKQLSSTPFWINDPLVLLKKDEMMDIWPAPLMSIEQKLNAISRIVILLSVLGFLITKNINIIFTGVITLAIFVMIYKMQHEEEYNMKNGKNGNKEEATAAEDEEAAEKQEEAEEATEEEKKEETPEGEEEVVKEDKAEEKEKKEEEKEEKKEEKKEEDKPKLNAKGGRILHSRRKKQSILA